MPELRIPISDEAYERFKVLCHERGTNPTVHTRMLVFDELRRNEQPIAVSLLPGHRQFLERYYCTRGTTLNAELTKLALRLYQEALRPR